MPLDRAVLAFAGIMALLSAGLTIWVSPVITSYSIHYTKLYDAAG